MSWIIFFDFSLNGLWALFCCWSAWRSCRWGWLSIFLTSSRTREFSACFHNWMWQSRYSEVDIHLVERCRRTHWLSNHNGSPRSIMICIFVFVCVFVFHLDVQQTNWYSRSHEKNVCRFPEHSNGTFVLSQRVSPFYNWIRVWLGWLVVFCLSRNFWTLIPSSNHLSKKSSEAVEVIHIIFRKWFLQFQSDRLSRYNKLGVYREEWQRSTEFDCTSNLSFEQV